MRLARSVSIRTRIALAIFAGSATLLVVMAFAVYESFAAALQENLDDTLRLRADANLRLVDLTGGTPRLDAGPDPGDERAEGDALLRLYSMDGQLLGDASPRTPVGSVEREAVAQAGRTGKVVTRDLVLPAATDLRIRVTAVRDGPAPAALMVTGLERSAVTEPLSLLRLILFLAIPTTAAALAVLGFIVARLALRPVSRITGTAAEIAGGDLSRRIPPTRLRDEVGVLTETFNAMIDRLAGTIERERRFTADASHELRTPLAAIETTADVTLSRERDPEEYRAALETVRGQARRLARLTRQLLALARMDNEARPALSPLDLGALVTSTVEAFRAGHPGLDVNLDLSGRPLTVHGDPDLLAQAVTNLLDNAVIHGRAEVRVTVGLAERAGSVVLSVADDGPGFPPALREAAFERFRRGDAARTAGGTGLGLAIVDSIARLHGGSAQLADPPGGRGALVEVSIPLAPR